MMDVLQRGKELIRGARQQEYGPPEVNLERIAMGWNAYLLGRDKDEPISSHDVCMMMDILKAMRMAEGYHEDSAADKAGYVGLAQRLHDGKWPEDQTLYGASGSPAAEKLEDISVGERK